MVIDKNPVTAVTGLLSSQNWLGSVDWSAPIKVPIVDNTAQYVAPCDGIFVAHLHAANYAGTRNTYLLLNGIDILSGYSNGDSSGSGGIFPVSAGDVIKIISSQNEYHVSKFYPYKK